MSFSIQGKSNWYPIVKAMKKSNVKSLKPFTLRVNFVSDLTCDICFDPSISMVWPVNVLTNFAFLRSRCSSIMVVSRFLLELSCIGRGYRRRRALSSDVGVNPPSGRLASPSLA